MVILLYVFWENSATCACVDSEKTSVKLALPFVVDFCGKLSWEQVCPMLEVLWHCGQQHRVAHGKPPREGGREGEMHFCHLRNVLGYFQSSDHILIIQHYQAMY